MKLLLFVHSSSSDFLLKLLDALLDLAHGLRSFTDSLLCLRPAIFQRGIDTKPAIIAPELLRQP